MIRLRTNWRKRSICGSAIKKKDGSMAVGLEEVKERWREYTEELFNDERQPFEIEINEDCLSIEKYEVEMAIRQMKHGRAIGEDGVAVEMLEAMEWWGIDKVTDLSNMIYSTGEIPAPMQISTFITIPKKPGAMECNKHRTISIMSQLSKIICRVIMNRIRLCDFRGTI